MHGDTEAREYRSGKYVVVPAARRLLHGDTEVEIEGKVFDLILLLLRNHERALDKQEVIDALWGHRPITDAALSQLIYKARRALHDDGEHQRVIRTIYGRGLQWVAPIETLPADTVKPIATPPIAADIATPHRRRYRGIAWAGATLVVLLGIAFGVLYMQRGRPSVVPGKSIAVLPFVNESGNKDEQYFSDGLSEDLINALSQFAGLKVISRNSAFQFRDGRSTTTQIGHTLGVAHLLEGSVQHKGDKVRITATLVNTADGSIVWSRLYDKPYKDLFALQDAITRDVAHALRAKLLIAPGAVAQSDRPPSGDLAAYAAYQHGIAYRALGTETGDQQAVAAFRQAIHLDPKYAAAYARLGSTWNALAIQFLADKEALRANASARGAVVTALKLNPDSSLAHQAQAGLLTNIDMDWVSAEAEARRALQLAPNDAAAQFGLGNTLVSLGKVQQAVELTRRALVADPLHASWYNWLSAYLAGLGRMDEAKQAIDTAITLEPDAAGFHEQLAMVEILRGDRGAALNAARRESSRIWHDVAMALVLQGGTDPTAADAALRMLVTKYPNLAPYQIAEVYALRADPDNMFKWLRRAWTNRDPGIGYLLYDPLILRYQHDPRFAAFCKTVGLPEATDAVAMKHFQ